MLQNTTDGYFTLEDKTKEVVVSNNIGLSLSDFKDIMDKNTEKIIDNNDKNTEKIREEIKVHSKTEKVCPEKSNENLDLNAFHELDSARTIDDICKSCPELKYHKDFNTFRCIFL